ncbi:MAG: VWA domain-containing protein [Anaerolineaceae bacterium]
MKTHLIHRALLVLLGICGVLASPASVISAKAEQAEPEAKITQVDVSQFPQVTLYISVTGADGQPWAIDPKKIRIYENDQLMSPLEISGEGEIGPLTTMLVMDVSGSMNEAGKLQAAKEAAIAYIDLLNPGDQVGVMAFNTEVQYIQPVTTDLERVKTAIRNLIAGKDTALFDSLIKAEEILNTISGRKAIVALTDGLDNRSQADPQSVITGIGDSGLSISTVGLGDPNKQGLNSGLDEKGLKGLAGQAGGLYAYANDAVTLKSIYERYGYLLKSEYRITYRTPSELRDGIRRSLRVVIGESDIAAGTGKTDYNPGGVLPDVDTGDAWRLFVILLTALGALLILPMLVQFIIQRTNKNPPSSKKAAKGKHITIKQPPKITIK